ncbi:hypothetical protein B9T31_14755 [Acinetobacter sp. ANC 4558]|uniref:DUF551 domain-containing protein n=1 Tax=Acinetobacter sp. ANC 4558 TaxID=1977876 RepID=UPI000A34F919|nr:DUF551 domain-containing protein [Acinetobacter sp. ANC 4558]OTG82549.1 hypothetical protein B9T31_14755 [Acinetobacter sp. ANC 4558]
MSNWISVKDGLPKEEESVLVLQDGNDVCSYLVLQAQIFQGDWYADHNNGIVDIHDSLDVDRWQRLPESLKSNN